MIENSKKYSFKKGILAFLIYCLPCLVALGVWLLYEYKNRTDELKGKIENFAKAIDVDDKDLENVLNRIMNNPDKIEGLNDLESKAFDEYFKDNNKKKQLMIFYIVQKVSNRVGFCKIKNEISSQINKIWLRNSIVVSIMALLPYILLGFRLAFSKNTALTDDDRFKTSWQNLPMKLILACVMVIGWLYILNPSGRGATTLDEYFIMEGVVESRTVPIYIASKELSPVLAGFLGWYLYLLQYFFRKLYFNDVTGTRVYRFLFGKFLFTYGIALVSSGIELEMPIAMFLIGFFPLSALTIIKEYGLKAAKGLSEGNAPLSELPGISTWYILRLEEEGIDNITTLAGCDSQSLKKALPKIMIPFIEIWIDVAQLFTVIGGDRYQKVKPFCQTASEFKSKSVDPEFKLKLEKCGVENPREIIDILARTF